MKTHTKTRMAMGLVALMALFLFGCTQYSTAAKMDTSTEGTTTETTGQHMGNTMDTKVNKTMKGDTMPGTMDTTKDKMMKDGSEKMMK